MRAATPDGAAASSLDVARQVADAVLYEGYVLFPYRASAVKNRYRWQWGVVVPPADVARVGESDGTGCDVLVRGGGRVRVVVRFLRLRHRQVHDADGHPVDRLDRGGTPVLTWDEGEQVELVAGPYAVDDLVDDVEVIERTCPRAHEREDLAGGGRVERTTLPVDVRLCIEGHGCEPGVTRLRLEVHNISDGPGVTRDRPTVLRRAMVGVHLLVVAEDGARFGSLVDPPAWAVPHVEDCARDGLHPVVVGPRGQPPTVVLASPIILADHPEVAPESPGPSFDLTEVDELLALAVMGLTDEDKREARATDPRAAELVDRTDTLPPEVMRRLHGRLQSEPSLADRSPVDDHVSDEVAELLGIGEAPTERIRVGGHQLELGSRVRLHPRRRADAHDMFVDGRVATVERIVTTVEGQTLLGVTLVDDPAAELHRGYGRFQYFDVTEVAPLAGEGRRATGISRQRRGPHEPGPDEPGPHERGPQG